MNEPTLEEGALTPSTTARDAFLVTQLKTALSKSFNELFTEASESRAGSALAAGLVRFARSDEQRRGTMIDLAHRFELKDLRARQQAQQVENTLVVSGNFEEGQQRDEHDGNNDEDDAIKEPQQQSRTPSSVRSSTILHRRAVLLCCVIYLFNHDNSSSSSVSRFVSLDKKLLDLLAPGCGLRETRMLLIEVSEFIKNHCGKQPVRRDREEESTTTTAPEAAANNDDDDDEESNGTKNTNSATSNSFARAHEATLDLLHSWCFVENKRLVFSGAGSTLLVALRTGGFNIVAPREAVAAAAAQRNDQQQHQLRFQPFAHLVPTCKLLLSCFSFPCSIQQQQGNDCASDSNRPRNSSTFLVHHPNMSSAASVTLDGSRMSALEVAYCVVFTAIAVGTVPASEPCVRVAQNEQQRDKQEPNEHKRHYAAFLASIAALCQKEPAVRAAKITPIITVLVRQWAPLLAVQRVKWCSSNAVKATDKNNEDADEEEQIFEPLPIIRKPVSSLQWTLKIEVPEKQQAQPRERKKAKTATQSATSSLTATAVAFENNNMMDVDVALSGATRDPVELDLGTLSDDEEEGEAKALDMMLN